jgi:hypothetical protein
MRKIRNVNHKDGWYEITPKDAGEILDDMKLNRALSQPNVDRIAEEIRRGGWTENGESLVFDVNGRLLDGQHRLRACMIAGKPIVSYCVWGVKAASFDTIDTGKIRGGSDLASILRLKNYKVCASAADWCIKYDRLKTGGRFPSGQSSMITNSAREDFFHKNRDLLESVSHAVVVNGKHLRRITNGPNVFAGALAIISREDPDKGEKWFTLVATGEGLSREHPAMLLRNKLADLKGQKYKPTQIDILALCIKSFCYFRDGRRVTLLKYSSEEAFPTISSTAVTAKAHTTVA